MKKNNAKAETTRKTQAARKQGSGYSKRRVGDTHASPFSVGLPFPGSEARSLPPVVPLDVEDSGKTVAITLVFFAFGCPSFTPLVLFFEPVLVVGAGISSTSGSGSTGWPDDL